jgi:fatty acid desaturase
VQVAEAAREQDVTASLPSRGRAPLRWTLSLAFHVSLLLVSFAVAARWSDLAGALSGAALAAFASVQIGYLAHDLDHGHVTGNRRAWRGLGLLCWNFLLGVSHGWWRDKHRRHHLDTHRPGHDPDLYALFGHEVGRVGDLGAVHRWFVAQQAWLFWPVTLFARVYFQWLGLIHAARRGTPQREPELPLLVLHHALLWGVASWLLGPRAFVFVVTMLLLSGLYMGLAFATNHLGVPHSQQRGRGTLWQAAHTRNIRCGRIGDYLLGGLNLQIEHHVYPWLPRAQLRAVRTSVRSRCEAAGLPYRESGLWRALCEVNGELARVARAARRT